MARTAGRPPPDSRTRRAMARATATSGVSRTALKAMRKKRAPITVTPAIRAERGIRSEEGVLIFKISPSVSDATGLRAGDVILAINRSAVRGASQVGELLNVRPGEIVRVYLEREGQITFTDLVFR